MSAAITARIVGVLAGAHPRPVPVEELVRSIPDHAAADVCAVAFSGPGLYWWDAGLSLLPPPPSFSAPHVDLLALVDDPPPQPARRPRLRRAPAAAKPARRKRAIVERPRRSEFLPIVYDGSTDPDGRFFARGALLRAVRTLEGLRGAPLDPCCRAPMRSGRIPLGDGAYWRAASMCAP